MKKIFSGKIGHTGTLDPMATGTLVCAIGEATRFIQFLNPDARKHYRASIQLGMTTDTLDITGDCIGQRPVPNLSEDTIHKCILKFTGHITQRPPIYSALKYQGKPYYYYARKGKEIPIPSRSVTIDSIDQVSYDHIQQQIHLTTRVSAGTYIRSLANDIAEDLGTYGCLASLHRQSIEPWIDCTQWSVDQVIASARPEQYLQSIESGLTHFDSITLPTAACDRLGHGIQCPSPIQMIGPHRLFDCKNAFRGLVTVEDRQVRPLKILHNTPQAPITPQITTK